MLLDDAGRVTGWNAGAEHIKGYRAEEILGQSFAVFYPPEEVERGEPARHLAEAAAAGHHEYEGWRIRKDGTRFWAAVAITAVFNDAGQVRGFGKVTRDATERHRAEQALRDSKEHFQLLATAARNYAIVMLDPGGLVVGWKAGAEHIKGYRAEEILGQSFAVFYPPEEVERGEPARHLAEAAAVGYLEYEGWRIRKDGSRFWAAVAITAVFNDAGQVRGFGKVTRDRTERRKVEKALQDSEEHFKQLVNTVRDYAIVLLDDAGRVTGWNAGAEHIKGYRAEEILGQSFAVFYPPEEVERGEPARHLAEAAAAGHHEYEGWRIRKDGTRFWADVVLAPTFDDNGQLRGFRLVARDLSDRHQLEALLAHQLLYDSLTGLGNRTLLMDRLQHALDRLPRHPGMLALLFIDLDRFKLINDSLGHEAGDELLIQAGTLLVQALRPEDLVVRLGGDEFVVLCEGLRDWPAVETVARRVTEALRLPVRLRGQDIVLSASTGVVATAEGGSVSGLLRDADAAMYQAKDQGRGRYAVLDEVARAKLSERLQITSELHWALERDELRAFYQPLVDLRTGDLVAVEALVRWQHPHRGLLSPGAFLSVAEDVGAVTELDNWMLRTAFATTVGLGRSLGVWVNLSGRSLADPALPEAVAEALDRSSIDPALVALEITEGTLMRDAATTVMTLKKLRQLGVQLAVDDFGTGYSSLSYLQQFPVHALKIDISFVSRLDLPPAQADSSIAIVRAIVSLASSLGLETVAEGIETSEQLSAVTALGCDLGQGYFLARPAPVDAIPETFPFSRPGSDCSEFARPRGLRAAPSSGRA